MPWHWPSHILSIFKSDDDIVLNNGKNPNTNCTLNFLEGIKWVFLEGNGRESHDIHHDVKLLKVNLIYEKKAFQSQIFFFYCEKVSSN